jgi:hypothetical protein
MKIALFKLKILSVGLFVYLFMCLCSQAHAQNNAVSVSPSILHLDLQSDQSEAKLYYKNTGKETVELTLSASDFTELEDGYKLSFLEGKDAKNYKYSLSSWIDFDKKTLIVDPGETGTITVFIKKERLTPGGHYGAVLAQISNKNPAGNVVINSSLSSLIFVRTNTGKENEQGKIEKFTQVRSWIDFPESFVMRFNNTGDVDVIPYGIVTIKDAFGQIVAKGTLNESSLAALPESIRRYDNHVVKQDKLLLPGFYKAELTGHFGKTNKKFSAATEFFSQGSLPMISVGFVVIILLFLLLKFKKKTTSY